MCFSAAASFTSSTVLATTGIISLTYARTTPKKFLAAIPLIFSIQQCIEGVLWMSLTHASWAHWQTATTYGFQVFAQMVWPLYIPLCAFMFEESAARKKMMSVFLLFGILLSAYTGYCLYEYSVQAAVGLHHIKYESRFPLAQQWYYGPLYFIPTILAPVLSRTTIMRVLGVLFLASYVIAHLMFRYYEISVWCFFGAVISFTVVFSIFDSSRQRASEGRASLN